MADEFVREDLENFLNERLPYHKQHLRRQLEAGGGLVLDRFDQAYAERFDREILVVATRPCRTERYIRSLAAAIRAVPHTWVYHSCLKSVAMDTPDVLSMPFSETNYSNVFLDEIFYPYLSFINK